MLGAVAERVPEPADRSIETVVEIDKRVCRPQTGPELVASDDLARSFQQESENLEGLFLKPYPGSITAQFASPQIDFEDSELDHPRPVTAGHLHTRSCPVPRSVAETGAREPRHLGS